METVARRVESILDFVGEWIDADVSESNECQWASSRASKLGPERTPTREQFSTRCGKASLQSSEASRADIGHVR